MENVTNPYKYPRVPFKGFLKGVYKRSIVGFYDIGASTITNTFLGGS